MVLASTQGLGFQGRAGMSQAGRTRRRDRERRVTSQERRELAELRRENRWQARVEVGEFPAQLVRAFQPAHNCAHHGLRRLRKVGGLVVQDALGRGHAVQAFVDSRDPFEGQEEVTVITGEVADTAAVYAAMAGRAQRMSVLSAGKLRNSSAPARSVAVKPGLTALNLMPGWAFAYWTVNMETVALEAP
jgi:NAD(P)H-binding